MAPSISSSDFFLPLGRDPLEFLVFTLSHNPLLGFGALYLYLRLPLREGAIAVT